MTFTKAIKHGLFICLVALAAPTALAAKAAVITVKQAKGANAIVAFPKGMTPKVGGQYKIAPTGGDDENMGGSDEMLPSGGSHGSREHLLTLSAAITKPKGSSLTMDVSASFGWNLGSLEVGPSLSFSKKTATSFGAGVFADINFIENKAPETFVPALGIKADFSHTTGANTITAGAELALKFFVLGTSSTAIRLAPIYFDFLKITGGTSYNLGLRGGLSVYF